MHYHTKYENQLAELRLRTQLTKHTLASFRQKRVRHIREAYDQGRIIISRVSDWNSLQLSDVLSSVPLESFTKQVFFNFELMFGKPIVTKVYDINSIQKHVAKTFHDPSRLYWTSYAKYDIAHQCQVWIESQPILADHVMWDDSTKTSGLASCAVTYVYTQPTELQDPPNEHQGRPGEHQERPGEQEGYQRERSPSVSSVIEGQAK
jgi:hypothetical protein